MSFVNTITITSTTDISRELRADTLSPQETAERLSRFMDKAALGCARCTMDVQTSGATTAVAAHGTLTLGAVVATNTATVAGQTFTAETSPSGNNQFAVGVTPTITATNLAAKIAAHPSLAGVVTATSSAAVVTVTAAVTGAIGNLITLTGGSNITASGATLTGGVNATPTVMRLGA